MKSVLRRLALLVALAGPALAQPLEVQLQFSPGSTLPALPVAMRVSVKNTAAVPVTVTSPMSVTMTDSEGASVTAAVSMPTAWAPQMSRGGRYTLAPGATLECIAPIDPFLAENELFLVSDSPLWKPGVWSVAATVFTTDGGRGTSNAATLTTSTLGGDDAAIWQALSGGGRTAFSSQTLLERFQDLIANHPASEYYRLLAPFVLNQREQDDDRYASNLTLAVQGLPGEYVDGARLAIAQRYADRALGESARNRQNEAGQWSAKGRVYAKQLAETPSSAFGAILGKAILPVLRTTEQWQGYHNEEGVVEPHARDARWPAPALEATGCPHARVMRGAGLAEARLRV